MKGKQLAILLLVFAALGGLWYLAGGRRAGVWSETGSGGGKVIEFPLNDVAQIVIASPAGSLHLVKKADEWTVQERAGYPANFETVSELLRKLWELKRVQVVKVGPSQLPRLELVEPGKGDKAGTEVQLLGADGKTLNAVLLGKKYLRKGEGAAANPMDFGGMGGADGTPAGRYVKRVGGETVALVTQTFDDADPKPERWLSKDFVKIENPKTISVAGPTQTQHWSITHDSAADAWKFADARPDETLDATKVSGLNSTLASLSFTDVLVPDAKIVEPAIAVTIDTFDGFHYELKIGSAQGDSHPVLVKVSASFPKERTPGKDEKPEDKARLDNDFTASQKLLADKLAKEEALEGRPYLVAKYSLEALLKERSALATAKPAATPTPSLNPAADAVPATPSIPVPAVTASPSPPNPTTIVTPPMPAPTPSLEAIPPTAPQPLAVPTPATTPMVTPVP